MLIIALLILSVCLLLVGVPLIRGVFMYYSATRGKPLAKLFADFRARPDYVPLREISPLLQFMIVFAEDMNFFVHRGVDFKNTYEALRHDLRRFRLERGGSCLTQQLAKNLYFSFRKTFARKVAELFVVYHLEHDYTKDDILEVYLNIIDYGRGNWGISKACRYYFDCKPCELTFEQCVSLAISLPAPRWRNAFEDKAYWAKHYDRLVKRVDANRVLLQRDDLDALRHEAQALLDKARSTRRRLCT